MKLLSFFLREMVPCLVCVFFEARVEEGQEKKDLFEKKI